MMHSQNKFSLRTNTFEPRTIFFTLYRIVLDVFKNDPIASFFFIGAEDERDQLGQSTRRFRVYRRFVLSIVSDHIFEHIHVAPMSLYILFNKKNTENNEETINQLISKIKEAFQE
jgi:hypothetical protein